MDDETDAIRILRSRDELEGTAYIELLPGRYQGRSWNDGSLFFEEEVFGYLEPIIQRHEPGFDHYSFTGISAEKWTGIIADLERLSDELGKAQAFSELIIRPGFLFGGTEAHFTFHFHDKKRELRELIQELVAWLKEQLKSHEWISVLGM